MDNVASLFIKKGFPIFEWERRVGEDVPPVIRKDRLGK
jgi:hypothetical protein